MVQIMKELTDCSVHVQFRQSVICGIETGVSARLSANGRTTALFTSARAASYRVNQQPDRSVVVMRQR